MLLWNETDQTAASGDDTYVDIGGNIGSCVFHMLLRTVYLIRSEIGSLFANETAMDHFLEPFYTQFFDLTGYKNVHRAAETNILNTFSSDSGARYSCFRAESR